MTDYPLMALLLFGGCIDQLERNPYILVKEEAVR